MQLLSKIPAKFLAILCALLPLSSFAKDANDFTVVNNFDKKLSFIVGINPQVLPDFPKKLLSGNAASATILVPIEGPKEAYIRVEVDDTKTQNAFWGVDVVDDAVRFHGYIGKGIAYSWKTNVITFCTPAEYAKKHSC